MGKSRNKGLSQAEIWDDSALLQSWDDALTEYKLYHSIHARGERVEDVIKSFEADEKTILANGTALPREAVNIGTNDAMPEDLEDGELEEPFENTEAKHNAKSEGNMQVSSTYETHHSCSYPGTETVEQQHHVHGVPTAIVNGVKDEAMKNLMMSWYYAGYYTGFYDGQQAQNSVPK